MKYMSALADYSIESNEVVLLHFTSGLSRRVSPDELPSVLNPEDLEKVRASLLRRANFIKTNLPAWARTLAISLAVSLMLIGSTHAVRQIWQRLAPAAGKRSVTQPPTGESQPKATSAKQSAPAQLAAPVAAPSPAPVEAQATTASPLESVRPPLDLPQLGPVLAPVKDLLQTLPLPQLTQPVKQLRPGLRLDAL